ncbi:MAG: phage tail assembly chaperone [Oscillospiraceae bacterium]|nr:phage tail assembly chaperone [Oscillospiraceae bacterium]
MKHESATKQPKYVFEPLENGRVRVTFFANETPVEREDGTHYEYDKYITETTDRPALEEIISGALDAWIAACASEEEKEAAAAVRHVRNRLLQESDATMVLDRMGLPLPDKITSGTMLTAFKDFIEGLKTAINGDWAEYRQALRDITEQPGFPFEVEWPEKPEK